MEPSGDEDNVSMTMRRSTQPQQQATLERSPHTDTTKKRKEQSTRPSSQHQSTPKKVKSASTTKASSTNSKGGSGEPPLGSPNNPKSSARNSNKMKATPPGPRSTSKSSPTSKLLTESSPSKPKDTHPGHSLPEVKMINKVLRDNQSKAEDEKQKSITLPSKKHRVILCRRGNWNWTLPTAEQGPHVKLGLDVRSSVMFNGLRYVPSLGSWPAGRGTRMMNALNMDLCCAVIKQYVEIEDSEGLGEHLKGLFEEEYYLEQADEYYNAPAFETDVIDVAMQEGYDEVEQQQQEQKQQQFGRSVEEQVEQLSAQKAPALAGSAQGSLMPNVSHGQQNESPQPWQFQAGPPSSSTGAAAAGGGGVAGHESTDACLSSSHDGQYFGSGLDAVRDTNEFIVGNVGDVDDEEAYDGNDYYEHKDDYIEDDLEPALAAAHESLLSLYCRERWTVGKNNLERLMLAEAEKVILQEKISKMEQELASRDAEKVILQEKISKMEQELAALKLSRSSTDAPGTEGTTSTTNGEAATHPATTINNSPEDSKKPAASNVMHGPAAASAPSAETIENATTHNGAADMDGKDDVDTTNDEAADDDEFPDGSS